MERNAFLGGNSTKATSGINGTPSRTQATMGIEDGNDVFLEDMVRSATGVKTGPMPTPYALAEMFVGNSGDAINWLQDGFGLALDTVSRMGGHSRQRTHRTKSGGKFPGMEITSALMKKYEQLADKDDGTCDLMINSILKGLVRDPAGRVIGVSYENADGEMCEHLADAVILATGGYGAGGAVQDSMLHRIRPDLCHLPTTNGDHSQGEGIAAALGAGAMAIGLQHVQVHPTGLVNPADPENRTKLLAAEALRGEGGIILDNEGNRFCNDIGKRDYVTGMMWSHDKAPYRLILNTKASSKMPWHCEHYKSRRVMKHFKNAAALAAEMGIPEENLKKSLAKYNDLAAAGNEDPETGKIYYTNTPFEWEEDYYVGIVTPVVHYTMGGLAISPKTECVDEATSRIIPGLYAAGEVTGGVHGRNRLGGSGLAEAVVLGRVAGQCALEYVSSPRPAAVAAAGGPATTTVISIPQTNGADPITITTTSAGGAGAETALGELIDVEKWEGEVTTQVGKVSSGALGNDGAKAVKAAEPAPTPDAGPATDVAVVYGSFFMGDSKRDASDILGSFPSDCGMSVSSAPIEGNNFNFNNLKDTKFLVVCTSSMYGNPPKNFWEFYFHLKAASENPNKPLAGMQHAVYGNGDETYLDTYMNVPRMVDTLLERAGSRRFYARGETGEPFTPLKDEGLESAVWAPGMWEAMKTADPKAPSVDWSALWEGTQPNYHDKVSDWDLKKLEKKFGVPSTTTIFGMPKSKL
jgi:flavocytochrome c